MDHRRGKPSRILLQLLWVPKIGDRVLCTYPIGKRRIARIFDSNLAGDYQLDIAGDLWWKTRHLTYVPDRMAYETALLKLQKSEILNWLTREENSKTKWKAALRCNETQMILQGTAQDIISDILNYRLFDSRINDAVNNLVAETRGESAIRFRSV